MSLEQIKERIDTKYVVFSILALATVIIASAAWGEYQKNKVTEERNKYWANFVQGQVDLNNQIVDFANNASMQNFHLKVENYQLKNQTVNESKAAENLALLDYYLNKSTEATNAATDAMNLTGDNCVTSYGQKLCYNKLLSIGGGHGGGGASVS